MNRDGARKLGILVFGSIEILIGCGTLAAVLTSLISKTSIKPTEVLIFVLTTAFISLSLGIGILRRSLRSYHLILFFSAVIILSKILIFGKIIYLSGALETSIPSSLKNLISIVYHGLLILFFVQPAVKKQFQGRKSRCQTAEP